MIRVPAVFGAVLLLAGCVDVFPNGGDPPVASRPAPVITMVGMSGTTTEDAVVTLDGVGEMDAGAAADPRRFLVDLEGQSISSGSAGETYQLQVVAGSGTEIITLSLTPVP